MNSGIDSYLYRAIKKYGIENFTIEQIDSANLRSELNQKEYDWIIKEDCLAPNGYNLRDGGNFSGISDILKENLQNKKWYYNPETGQNIVINPDKVEIPIGFILGVNKEYSEETKQKMRENISKLCWFHNPETLEEIRINPEAQTVPENFIIGRSFVVSEENKENARNRSRNTKYYHDPITFVERMIKPDEKIPDGWIAGRSYSWFHNPQTKEIIQLKLNSIIPDGFYPGRNMSPNKGRKRFYNPILKKRIYLYPDDIIPDGYVDSSNEKRKKSSKEAASKSMKKLTWFYNPETNEEIRINIEITPLPPNFIRGRLKKSK